MTINFYKRNYIEGLFLSSAIIRNPNHTMEEIYRTIELLRNLLGFHGYIHVKAIPGVDSDLIRRTGELVDRMSVNIELPSATSLKLLAPQKDASAILKPMSYIANQIAVNKEERQHSRMAPSFVPAGQSTQLIIGATTLFHSDRGFQYTSLAFRKMLDDTGCTQSMSRVGRCLDNARWKAFGYIEM